MGIKTRTHRCPPDHAHGETGTCYVNHKCGCDDCRRGRAEYQYWRAAHRNRVPFVDATGTRRRLQALAALGWSMKVIAERYGHAEVTVAGWSRADRIHSKTAQKIARWYDDLSMTIPPTETKWQRYSVGSTKGRAAAAGWAPPLAWDDDTIDDPAASPAMASDKVHVLDELDHLRAQGESPHQAVKALHRTPDALERLAYRHHRPDLALWVTAA